MDTETTDDFKCETCGRIMHPEDNIIGRWCDPKCADANEEHCALCKKVFYECNCHDEY